MHAGGFFLQRASGLIKQSNDYNAGEVQVRERYENINNYNYIPQNSENVLQLQHKHCNCKRRLSILLKNESDLGVFVKTPLYCIAPPGKTIKIRKPHNQLLIDMDNAKDT